MLCVKFGNWNSVTFQYTPLLLFGGDFRKAAFNVSITFSRRCLFSANVMNVIAIFFISKIVVTIGIAIVIAVAHVVYFVLFFLLR